MSFDKFIEPLLTAIIGGFIGGFFAWHQFKKSTRHIILLEAKNSIIAEKVNLIGILTGVNGISNISNVQIAIEKIKSSINSTVLGSINEAWQVYYHIECNKNPKIEDRLASIGALDSIITIINNEL